MTQIGFSKNPDWVDEDPDWVDEDPIRVSCFWGRCEKSHCRRHNFWYTRKTFSSVLSVLSGLVLCTPLLRAELFAGVSSQWGVGAFLFAQMYIAAMQT